MNDLTIIKQGGGAYLDSREVAEIIGKRHDNLLRDIDGYLRVLEKFNALNFEGIGFFAQSSYIDVRGRAKPCYLISRRGADIIANKLTGERGVLFTAAYVTKFHEMSERDREDEIAKIKAQAAAPGLPVFNEAVRNVLKGMSLAKAPPNDVMDFLRGAYKPFGIVVRDGIAAKEPGGGDRSYYSAADIAGAFNVYSRQGKPHARAVSAIIEKLGPDPAGHVEITPYGLGKFSMRYDAGIAEAVAGWIDREGYPPNISHNGIEYHVVYEDSAHTRPCRGRDTETPGGAGLCGDDDPGDDFWD